MDNYKFFGILVFSLLLLFGCLKTPVTYKYTDAALSEDEQNALEIAHQTEEAVYMLKKQQAFALAPQCTEEEFTQAVEDVAVVLGIDSIEFNASTTSEVLELAQQCNLEIVEQISSDYTVRYNMKTSPICPNENIRYVFNSENLVTVKVEGETARAIHGEVDNETIETFDSILNNSGNCFSQVFILFYLFGPVEDGLTDHGITDEAIVAIDYALAAIDMATEDGKLEGLDAANEKIDQAIEAYNEERYEEALALAIEAAELADVATLPPIDETPEEALDAIYSAMDAYYLAEEEGRTEELELADEKIALALEMFDQGNFEEALALALEAAEIIDAATSPEEPPEDLDVIDDS